MAVPTITSITPSSGPTEGRSYTTIVGTGFRLYPPPPPGLTTGGLPNTVRVSVDGVAATHVRVREDPSNPPDGTIATCLTPAYRGDPETLSPTVSVDVSIQNLDDDEEPIAGEMATEEDGYEYGRPSLVEQTKLTALVRAIIRELRRRVTMNVSWSVHSDYDDDASDGLNITKVSKLPALIISGPELPENRFYSTNEPIVLNDGATREKYIPSRTVDVRFNVTGIANSVVQLLNLLDSTSRFFTRNVDFEMDRDPEDPSAGRVSWEIEVTIDFRVDSVQNNANVRSFTGQFAVIGFDIDEGVLVERSAIVEEVEQGTSPVED